MKDEEKKLIRTECASLCDSRSFKSSERMRQLLHHLVERTLEGDSLALTQRRLANDFFERNRDFNPEEDSIVRVEVSKLRRSLSEFNQAHSQRRDVVISIHPNNYTLEFRFLNRDKAGNTAHESDANLTSLAILPFQEAGEDSKLAWLADALRDELGIILNRSPLLRVSAKDHAQSIGASPGDLAAACQSLSVRFLVGGKIYYRGTRIRICAWLHDFVKGSEVWTNQYDLELSSERFFEVLDSVAQQIVAESVDLLSGIAGRILASELDVCEGVGLLDQDVDVYECAVRFNHYQHNITAGSYQQARQRLEQVFLQETDNPLVLSMLGDLRRAGQSLGFARDGVGLEEAIEMQRRALTMQPDFLSCKVSYGFSLLMNKDVDALKQLALSITEDATAPHSIKADASFLQALAGDWEAGSEGVSRYLGGARHYPAYLDYIHCLSAYHAGDYEAALSSSAASRTTGCFWEPVMKAACYGQLRKPEAEVELSRLCQQRPDFASMGKEYISAFIPSDETVDHLLGGVRKAGLDVN